MKTLLDISDEDLQNVQKYYRISTKKEAVNFALRQAVKAAEREKLVTESGSFDGFDSASELIEQRENDSVRVFCLD